MLQRMACSMTVLRWAPQTCVGTAQQAAAFLQPLTMRHTLLQGYTPICRPHIREVDNSKASATVCDCRSGHRWRCHHAAQSVPALGTGAEQVGANCVSTDDALVTRPLLHIYQLSTIWQVELRHENPRAWCCRGLARRHVSRKREAMHYFSIESAVALLVSLFINVSKASAMANHRAHF
jgi:hypothetical protein